MTETFQLTQDDQGRLILHRPGEPPVIDARVRRSFPWSVPDRFVSIRTPEGKEVVLIDSLDSVAAETRSLIEQHLAKTAFVPRITHVDEVDVTFGHQQWRVRTDRGPVEFRVQEREDLRFLQDGRFSIKDAEGNVYELPPLDELDPESRRAVEALL